MDEIKIQSTTELADGQSTTLMVNMDDGSVWTCTPDGTNWTKVRKSDAELQELFNLHLQDVFSGRV